MQTYVHILAMLNHLVGIDPRTFVNAVLLLDLCVALQPSSGLVTVHACRLC